MSAANKAHDRMWSIKTNQLELGRDVVVIAATKKEAMQKLRARDWHSCGDPEEYVVTKVGPCVEINAMLATVAAELDAEDRKPWKGRQ